MVFIGKPSLSRYPGVVPRSRSVSEENSELRTSFTAEADRVQLLFLVLSGLRSFFLTQMFTDLLIIFV